MSADVAQVVVRAARDTTLYANVPDASNGEGGGLFCGPNNQGSPRRALLFFDVAAALPRGAKIETAELGLQMTRGRTAPTMISVHRLTSDWGEGDSASSNGGGGGGSPAAQRDATWSHAFWPDRAWLRAGGDFVGEASAVTTVTGLASYRWSSVALARDAQSFLDDPAQNFGWILLGESSNADAKRFASREDLQGAPQLVLSYLPPASPTGACCRADGSCGIQLDPGEACKGAYLGAGTSCSPNICPEPMAVCCLPDARATCEIRSKSGCAEGSFRDALTSCDPNPCPVVLASFVDPLPLPAPARPVKGRAGEEASYRLSMVQIEQKLHRDLPATKVWGFSDGSSEGYPGPSIEARRDKAVQVVWANDLRDEQGELLATHALAVDQCLHGVSDDAPRTVVHLHGGHVPESSDGYPEDTLLPGEEVRYDYPNHQRAATLWYHDHAAGITRLNVYMGLAGFYLLRDDDEDSLELPSGEYEVPLAIQDRTFYPDGRLRYPEQWQDSFFGDQAVVNGKVKPYLEVKRGLYRFRVLNGSTSRAYTLALSTGWNFLQIGNDGGLLPESFSVPSVTIVPGERADIVIDFRNAGREVVLKNSARSPYPLGGSDAAPLQDILRFVVSDEPGYTTPVPIKLSTIEPLVEADSVTTRDLKLAPGMHMQCGKMPWSINGLDWNDITETPSLGTSEIWRFVNQSGITHPMHMHGLFFQVLDRQANKLVAGELEPDGAAQQPRRGERGWKDTVQVGPFEAVRVIARFEDYPGRFPYHCHLLEHEDHGMMRQFEVQSPCGDGIVAPDLEACDDGNTQDGDGCSKRCELEEASPAESAGEDAPRSAEKKGCAVHSGGRRVGGAEVSAWLLLAALIGRRTRRRRD